MNKVLSNMLLVHGCSTSRRSASMHGSYATANMQAMADGMPPSNSPLASAGEKGAVTGASGATATVALIHRSKAIFASLGDSLAVLCRAGQPVRLTTQHRVYGVGQGVLEEMERVEAAGGWIVDGRVCNVLAVSRAFGDLEFKVRGGALATPVACVP